MKSVKEEAEELSTAFRKEQGDVGYSEQLSYKLGVEAGANYVLDAIEECFNPKDDIVKQWGAIATLVEQLKGNK